MMGLHKYDPHILIFHCGIGRYIPLYISMHLILIYVGNTLGSCFTTRLYSQTFGRKSNGHKTSAI
jgi:hypothetical protein